MKKIQLSIIILLLAILVIGCNNGDQSTEETDKTVNEETGKSNSIDDNEVSDNENDPNSNDGNEKNTDDGEFLSIGETGVVESVVGDYEITVNAFEYLDKMEGESSMLDFYILIDYTVKNIGDEVIKAEDIYGADLFDDQELSEGNSYYYDSVNMLEGNIEVNETVDGELLFHAEESKYYDLVFNFGALESNATRLTWRLNADEASN
ncbi:DUF4352 domain-containing protein [Gracilibacillus saliphilus]|uniref:DUF4352 domain-containing protein n=1 Tax=Gracilibacillus saliphilus TaxID=543890 RepID=UPI0013D1E1C6|nr:DUF4352 domain-containing protein [Gracilibacillus saliphilus]